MPSATQHSAVISTVRRHRGGRPPRMSPLAFRAERRGYLPRPVPCIDPKIRMRPAWVSGLAPPILSAVGIGFPRPLRLVIPVGRRNWRRVRRITSVIELAAITSSPGPIVIQV